MNLAANKTLFKVMIDDIPLNVPQDFLAQLINNSGIKLISSEYGELIFMRPKKVGRDFTNAIVYLESEEYVNKIIDELNYVKLDGYPIRVFRYDDNTKKILESGKGNLIVSGFDDQIEVSQLHEAFSHFGEIITCKISMKKVIVDGEVTFVSNGYGYVFFRDPINAHKAMEDLSDAIINGKSIQISEYNANYKSTKTKSNDSSSQLVLKNLPEFVKNESDLRLLFPKNISIDTINFNYIKQMAFCKFPNADSLRLAQEFFISAVFNTGPVIVENYLSSNQISEQAIQNTRSKIGRNLYVSQLPSDVTKQEIYDYFTQFGEIEEYYIPRKAEDSDSYVTYCFVCYKLKESAQKAIKTSLLNRMREDGKKIKIEPYTDPKTRDQNRKAYHGNRETEIVNRYLKNKSNPMVSKAPIDRNRLILQLKGFLFDEGVNNKNLSSILNSLPDSRILLFLNNSTERNQWIQSLR